MRQWREVYRSASKRVLRRKSNTRPVVRIRVVNAATTDNMLMCLYILGGVLCVLGLMAGGMWGVLLFGFGVLCFFGKA